jgi:hypothetical protein
MLQSTRVRSRKRRLKAGRRHKAARMARGVAAECLETRLLLSASVVTYHNDNASDGQNTQETVLTPSNVNSTSFGKIFTTSVDGNVYAQPLFVPGLTIAGGVHNVVFVATEHDSVYALDAASGNLLWQDSFLTSPISGLPGATSITTVPDKDVLASDIHPELGITSTPVIDPATNTMYVDDVTKEMVNGVAHYVQQLFSVNISTGAENFRVVNGQSTNAPMTLGDTTFINGVYTNNSPIWVNGTGEGNDGQGHVFFNALRQLQRPALTLANGQLYIAWGSIGDNSPYHAWLAALDPTTLALTGVLNATPNGSKGSFWMSGGRLSVDASGALYGMTGNGTFDGSNSGGTITGLNAAGFPVNGDYGDSFVKITADTVHNSPTNQNINGWGLQISDYFTPWNQASLSSTDKDLGSGAPLVLPDAAGSTAHPHLLVGGGKQGRIYLLDRDNLGKFSLNQTVETTHIVEEVSQKRLAGPIFDTPAYFNQQIYFAPQNATAKSFSVPNKKAHINPTPVSISADTFGLHGSTPSISSNGSTNGIVWDIDLTTNELRAYNATGYNTELYTSDQAANSRDALGTAEKFTVPTVANGYVYVGTTNSIVGYGLLAPPAGVPATSASTLNPHLSLSQSASTNASASVGSGSTSNVHTAVQGSDEEESSAHSLDGLFATQMMKGSSPPPFAQLDASKSVPKRPPETADSDALPASAIDDFFSKF